MASFLSGFTMSEDLIIVSGLLVVQAIYAGNAILMTYLMSLGLGPFTIVVYSTFATFVIISPAAVYQERSKWPKEFSFKLVIRIFFISFTGVLLFQSLFLEGIHLTSPALATAMANLGPGFIFLIAWGFGFEKVNLSCNYSKVKIVGTLVCIVGAIGMSLMHSTGSSTESPADDPQFEMTFDKDKIIGCGYLLAAVFVLACNVVLQASTIADFPAPLSLCSITSLVGVGLAIVAQCFEDRSQFIWPVDMPALFAYFILGGAIGGFVVSFNGWALSKKGSVFVSIFSPIATVLSVILSAITLGETLNLGSIGGMLLMFVGLYLVLWAKGKESDFGGEENYVDCESNAVKPLLVS